MKSGGTPLYNTPELGDRVTAYAEAHSTALPAPVTDLHASHADHKDSEMLSSNFQSQFHLVLAKSIQAKRVLEIGVFLGYSAMVWSTAVGPDGLVTGLEYSPEYAAVARESLASRGVDNVDIIVGAAAETLPALKPEVPYDLVFIDADKEGYEGYVKQLLAGSAPGSEARIMRKGALIIADNVLRRGFVADESAMSEEVRNGRMGSQVRAVQKLNSYVVGEPRLQTCVVPLWDGLTLATLLD